MESLPREIIVDILSRLPVTSLLQLKLVCKAFHNLLQDPFLVLTHFSRTALLNSCLILHTNFPIRNQLYSLELSALTVNKIRVPALPEFKIVGSCKGLLCLLDSSTRNLLYVYNPFSRKYKKLPESSKSYFLTLVCGFGFDSRTNEYKVIKIMYRNVMLQKSNFSPYYRGLTTGFQPAEVEILTLGRDTAWRKLGKFSTDLLNQKTSQVLINGRIHWDASNSIISFDLEDEQFRVVGKPPCGGLNRCKFDLVDLGGSLSAVVCDIYGRSEIWVMKEYDVKESWIKEYNIDIYVPRSLEDVDLDSSTPSSSIFKRYGKRSVRVLGLLKTGEVLMQYRCRALFTYDKRNNTFKDLTRPGLPDRFNAIVLNGSLNWINTFSATI